MSASSCSRVFVRASPAGSAMTADRSRFWPLVVGLALREELGPADELLDLGVPEVGHEFAELLRDERHVVDDVVRLAGEALAEVLALGRDADGTGVLVALSRHHAAGGDERRGAEHVPLGRARRRRPPRRARS